MVKSSQHIKQFGLSILFVCLSLVAFSQAKFYATVNKTEVPLNGSVKVTFKLENGNSNKFNAPDFSGFKILQGPFTSTSMQFINGQTSSSKSWQYTLRPSKEGKLKIGIAKIKVDGKFLQTKEINITVTAAVTNPNANNNSNNSNNNGGGDEVVKDTKPTAKELSKDVFVRVIVDKTEAYVGEQITATFKVYFNRTIYNTQPTETPTFGDFWRQDIDLGANNSSTTEVYNGKKFNVATVMRVALFPQRAGDLKITPIEYGTTIQYRIQKKPRNYFEQIWGRYEVKNMQYTFSSANVSIKAKPLPKDAPDDFYGLVGSYDMDASIDKTDVETDDPITVKIKLSGKGNIRAIEDPELVLPQSFEIFDPTLDENISKMSATVNGSKAYEWLIVPRLPGEYILKPYSVSYFDVASESYETLSSEEYTLNITGEPSILANSNAAEVKEEVEVLDEDIRHIKTEANYLKSGGASIANTPLFWALFSSPALLALLLVFIKRKRSGDAADVVGQKMKKANKEALKRLSNAKKHLENNDKKGFYNEVSKAIWKYIGNKLNIDQSALSKQEASSQLKAKDVSEQSVDGLIQMIEESEVALYAPGDNATMQGAYKKAVDLISKLESELNK